MIRNSVRILREGTASTFSMGGKKLRSVITFWTSAGLLFILVCDMNKGFSKVRAQGGPRLVARPGDGLLCDAN